IILASALQADRRAPLVIAAGLSTSFVILGVGIGSFGPAIGLDLDTVTFFAACLMIVFGVVLLVPQFNARFAGAAGALSGGADDRLAGLDFSGTRGQFLGGLLLGAVWSPCIGPTLGGAIALAAQGESLLRVTAIMISFAAGVSAVLLALAYGSREAILRRRNLMRRLSGPAKPLMGVVFVAVGLMIVFGVHYRIEAWLLDVMPIWLQDLSVSL
ncbi:MAG: cytochrome c biogenesis protein CcdA, partial [Pseudomonadota bacterium]